MQLQKPLLLAALTASASLGSLALAPSAQAIATYTLPVNAIGLGGGGFINGTFDYDSNPGPNGTYSNINLTVSGTANSGQADWTTVGLTQGTGFILTANTSSTRLEIDNSNLFGSTNVNFRGINLVFNTPLTGIPGDAPTLTNASGVAYGSGTGSFGTAITGSSTSQPLSSATPVPLESDALPIVGSAAFMAGGLWWKRRRSQAKANLDFLGVASEK